MKLLLLLLPTVALASIEVKLRGEVFFDSKYFQGNINFRGLETRAITDSDRVAFHIQEEELKLAIERYYGKKPDQIFFNGDTPWGDLYNKHGWNPVQVKIEPQASSMVDIFSKKVVLTRSIYENAHIASKKIYIKESETTYDTVTSLWINPSKVSGNKIDITFTFNVENDVASLNYPCTFGSNHRTTAKKLRSQSGSLDLAAGQRVLAQFEAKKGTLKFQIQYKVSLFGDVVVNYNNKYKDHYFHGLNINQVLGHQRNSTLNVYQSLMYEFYYGQNLKIINAEDGYSVLKSYNTEDVTSSGKRRRAGVAKHAAETGKKITRKAVMMPFELSDEDLKSIVEEVLENTIDDESSESSEQQSTEKNENKTPLEVTQSE